MSTTLLTWNVNDIFRMMQIMQLVLSVKLKAWRLSDHKSGPIDHFSVFGAAVVDVGLVFVSTKLANSTCRVQTRFQDFGVSICTHRCIRISDHGQQYIFMVKIICVVVDGRFNG